MVQTRICSYYESHCSRVSAAPTTFLSLPEDIRDRIYCEAGVITGASIRIFGRTLPNYMTGYWSDLIVTYNAALFCTKGSDGVSSYCASTEVDEQTEKTEIYYNLSVSNFSISVDVTRYLYSHNNILLCCEDYTDLNILLDTAFSWIASLRCLTIHLNPVQHRRFGCREEANCCHRGWSPHSHPLKSSSATFYILSYPWWELICRLSTAVKASSLKLNILCDVADEITARQILQPMEAFGLTKFTIRLGPIRDRRLTTIAHEVLHPNEAIEHRPPPFMELPPELRQHILSFTDLVTPLREVVCIGNNEFGCVRDQGNCQSGEFCATNRAVYPPCSCWVSPTPLFLVCKAMLQDARAVFYASNRFKIAIYPERFADMFCGKQPCETSSVLSKEIPEEALSHLRSLWIGFPSVMYDLTGRDAKAYEIWKHAIEYAAPRLKRLTLRLSLSYCFEHSVEPQYVSDVQKGLEPWFQVQERIVQPLSRLKSLEDCFVQVKVSCRPGSWAPDTVKEQQRIQEVRLETLVMGNGYDSIARGKSFFPEDEDD